MPKLTKTTAVNTAPVYISTQKQSRFPSEKSCTNIAEHCQDGNVNQKSDINIELDRNVFTISSQTKSEKEEKKEEKTEAKAAGKYLIKERSYSKFSRSFTLPEDVDRENLSAKVTNGVLTVTMPRKAIAAPKRIAITAEQLPIRCEKRMPGS